MTSGLSSTPVRHDLLDTLWYAASAKGLTMGLLALLALTLAIGALIAPNQLAYLVGGIWLRLLLGILAYNLALRLVAQAEHLPDIWRPFQPVPPPNAVTQRLNLSGPLDALSAWLAVLLRRRYRQVIVETQPTRTQIYAGRGRPGIAGPFLTYLGPLLLLIGLSVNDAAGWRAGDIALAPHSTTTLVRAGGLRITVEQITDSGAVVRSTLALVHPRYGAQTVQLAFARPARWGNLWLAQRATGSAVAVRAHDVNGRPLVLQSLVGSGEAGEMPHLLFYPDQTEQALMLPTHNLALRVVSYPALPEKGFAGPVFLVETYRGDETSPALAQLIENEGSLTLDDVTFVLQRERYVVFDVAYLPGAGLLLLGGLVTLAGVILALAWEHIQAWVNLVEREKGVSVTLSVMAPVSAQSELASLARAAQTRAEAGHAA